MSPQPKRARVGLVYDAQPAATPTACAALLLGVAAASALAVVAPILAPIAPAASMAAFCATGGATSRCTVYDSYAAQPSPASTALRTDFLDSRLVYDHGAGPLPPATSLFFEHAPSAAPGVGAAYGHGDPGAGPLPSALSLLLDPVQTCLVYDVVEEMSGGVVVAPCSSFQPFAPPPVRAAGGPAAALADSLALDRSEHALRPSNPLALYHLCADVFSTDHDNQGSRKKIDADLVLWQRWCATWNTPAWRPDFGTLSSVARQREAALAAGFLPWVLTKIRGRKGPRALPATAFKKYLHIVKLHFERGIQFTPSKLVNIQLKRLCRQHVSDFGAASLVPTRKEPMTRVITLALLAAPGGSYDHFELDWSSRSGRALKALILVLASTGMRKSEVASVKFDRTCASRADLVWHLRGKSYASPPPLLLESPHVGDFVTLRPPLSKADQFGEVWGASPIYISYLPGEPLCAYSALAELERRDQTDPAARASTPLISPDGIAPFTPSFLDSLLRKLLALPTVLGPVRAKSFSWHSFRIGLATSLLASGASRPMILALCRWQTEESLNIYARLDRKTYADSISRALRAEFFTARTTTIDFEIDNAATVAELLQTRDDDLAGD